MPTLRELFLELAQPDAEGFSRKVYVDEFNGRYEGLRLGNGGSWCREDGALGDRFNIERSKVGNSIAYIALHGYKKQPIGKASIPPPIYEQVRAEPCAVLAVHAKTEVDHRDGRRDDPRLTDAARVMLDDFQALSKAVNNAKRQHCKECRRTGQRFDARQLGYAVAQVKGNGAYRGTCIGCYWYDPKGFNQEVSRNYERP